MNTCAGTANDHCCYVDGKVCTFLEENTVPGRRWACGLRRELGDWDAVLADPRYVPIQAALRSTNCRDFPAKGDTCSLCGFGL